MKILLVIDSLKRGGKEGQFGELLKGLKAYDDIQVAVVIRKNIIEYPEILGLGHDIFIAPSPSLWKFAFYLNAVIKAVRPDVINSWEGFVTLNSVLLGTLRRIRVINFDMQYAHRVKILSSLYIQEKFNQLLAYRNMANSYAGLRTFHLRPSNKTRVIHNGLDINRADGAVPINIREQLNIGKAFLIAMVASFSPPKDYRTLLEAGQKILADRQDVYFALIGEGPERAGMQALVPQELAGHFFFLGRRSDVTSIVKEIDIGVLLSKEGHAEGISNSIMEYMAAGKPVIATAIGGNPELVVDGTTGYLIPYQDEAELIGRLRRLLDDPQQRSEMGRQGRDRIINHFGLDRMVRRFVDFYREVAGAP